MSLRLSNRHAGSGSLARPGGLLAAFGLAVVCVLVTTRNVPVQAQPGGRAESMPWWVPYTCDLIRVTKWPRTNDVLRVALLKMSVADAESLRISLERSGPGPWRQVSVTNYATTLKADLPGLQEFQVLVVGKDTSIRFLTPLFAQTAEADILTVGVDLVTFTEKRGGQVALISQGGFSCMIAGDHLGLTELQLDKRELELLWTNRAIHVP